MWAYVIRRISYLIPMLALVSIVAFIVIELPPGDIFTDEELRLRRAGNPNAAEIVEARRELYGLNEPVIERYFIWIGNIIFEWDFGISILGQRAVTEIIRERLPTTLLITALSIIFTWILSIPIGIYSAVRKYTLFDYSATFLAFIGMAIPNFLLALILMLFAYNTLGWGIGGLMSEEFIGAPFSVAKLIDMAQHLIIPVIVVGTSSMAGLVRVLRGMVLDEMGKLYVLTARAKGMPERVVIWKHILKIAMIPVISTIGWILPALISGETITAIVMNLPTIGQVFLRSLQAQDSFVSGALILILSTLTIVGSLVSDILLAVVDKRIVYT
jgi:peptide/nickel transport system permease protein